MKFNLKNFFGVKKIYIFFIFFQMTEKGTKWTDEGLKGTGDGEKGTEKGAEGPEGDKKKAE